MLGDKCDQAVNHEPTRFEIGVLFAAATLVDDHDQPGMAADIISAAGLQDCDCSKLDDMDKVNLRKINEERGMQLQGL